MARIGRPRGTEIDDTHVLREMARERQKHPELTVERLGKMFEHLAEGAHGPGSVARPKRLARKFRARVSELMAWAKEHPAD